MSKARALIIDDELDILELLGITLERMQIEVSSAPNIKTAMTLLQREEFQLCLTDMKLADGDGLTVVEWIQQFRPHLPVAVITAHGNVESAVRALKLGAFDFISKPIDLIALRKLITATLKFSTQSESTSASPENRLLGNSGAMQNLRNMIDKVARSQAPVHIYGESGTGKELVAQLIHETSARCDGPFVPVNCGAIPNELMESEFFGYKKGSFTGATTDKQGLIQSAEGGTLFLDEIADLPLHMQVKLLRVIQQKTIRPLGATQEIPIDIRILSATHKHLGSLVSSGKFREDLFYRINVIEIDVPALRERAEDIKALVESILKRQSHQLGQTLLISQEAMNALSNYSFPGNVRELENILERAATLCTQHRIGTHDLQLRTPTSDTPERTGNTVTLPILKREPLGDALEELEREAIMNALNQTRFNKTKAAALLGMSFRSLRYRIKKLGLE